MKNASPRAARALSRLLVMVMALLIGFGQAAPSFAQAVDPVARGLAARANTSAGISAAGGALRTAKIRLGAIGDSRLNHDIANYLVTTGSQPFINDTVGPAVTKVAGHDTRGPLAWLEALSFGQIRAPSYDVQTASAGQVAWVPTLNQSVGGSVSAALPVQARRLVAQSPRATHAVMLSGYNDASFYGIFSDADALTALARAKDNYVQACAILLAAGIQPIIIVDLPADFAGNTFRVKYHQALREWQRQNAEALGAWFIDVADVMADPASSVGAPLAAYYSPESPMVHPGPRGAQVIGQRLLALFTSKGLISTPNYGQTRQDVYDSVVNTSGNLIPNAGLMIGSGGLFNGTNPPTGQAPNNWNGRNENGGTGGIVSSVQARPAGLGQGQDWKVVITATTDTSFRAYTDLGNVSVGDIVSGAIELNVDASTNLDRINVYLQEIDSTGATSYQQCGMIMGGQASAYGLMPTTFGGRFQSEKMQIGNSGAKVRVLVEVVVTAGGSATIRIGPAAVRKVSALSLSDLKPANDNSQNVLALAA